MNLSMEGLLGGLDDFISPKAPAGAGYDNETARMARAALLGNIGASLLAAGQGGGPPGSRAAALATLGQGPAQAAEILKGGVNSQYVRKQGQLIDQQIADKAKRDAYFSSGGVPGAAPGGTVAPTGPGAAPAPVPAPSAGPGRGMAPGAPVPGEEPRPPVQPAAPVVPSAAPGGYPADLSRLPPWFRQAQGLGLTFAQAQQIAGHPDRDAIVKQMVEKDLERRQHADIVEENDGSKWRIYGDGRREQITQPDINKKQIPGAPSPQQVTGETTLRGEFNTQTKGFTDRQTAFKTMQDLAAKGEGASDMALVLSLMKVFDPTSTVTSGENATASNAPGVPDGIRAAWNRLLGEGQLSEGGRKQLVAAAEQRYGQEYDTFGRHVENYNKLATQYGLDPSRVVQDSRDPIYGQKRQMQQISVGQIMRASREDIEKLTPAQLGFMSPEQQYALKQRLNSFKAKGGR